MRIAIIYATKSGTTKECACLLARQLQNHDVSVLDVSEVTNMDGYDTVIFGFSIRMGRALKNAKRFMKNNAETLSQKRASYFICCGFIDCFEDYVRRTIPAACREAAVAISCFGGHLDPSKVKGFDKIVVKEVRNEILGGGDNGDQRDDMVLPTILDENIVQFAERIKSCAK